MMGVSVRAQQGSARSTASAVFFMFWQCRGESEAQQTQSLQVHGPVEMMAEAVSAILYPKLTNRQHVVARKLLILNIYTLFLPKRQFKAV